LPTTPALSSILNTLESLYVVFWVGEADVRLRAMVWWLFGFGDDVERLKAANHVKMLSLQSRKKVAGVSNCNPYLIGPVARRLPTPH
jgi:hypothetical protein